MKAFDPKRRREYVLQAERALAPELRTVFVLKPLSVFDRAAAQDSGNADGIAGKLQNRGALEMARLGLAGWRNLLDESGKAVEPTFDESGALSRDSFALLPMAVAMELFVAVAQFEQLTESDAGK